MIRLTVTGDRFQVASACKARGIPAALAREDSHGGTCDVDAANASEELARAWQREEPKAPPYPVGACLCVHKLADSGILGSRNARRACSDCGADVEVTRGSRAHLAERWTCYACDLRYRQSHAPEDRAALVCAVCGEQPTGGLGHGSGDACQRSGCRSNPSANLERARTHN